MRVKLSNPVGWVNNKPKAVLGKFNAGLMAGGWFKPKAADAGVAVEVCPLGYD
jgi:hypothetical protein